MHDDWIPTASGLPSEGNVVDFVLDARFHPIRGTYLLGHFESRWAKYAPPNVRQWRAVSPASAAMPSGCLPRARLVVSVK